MPAAGFGAFVARIPAPLGIGKITLDDGSAVSGFLCERYALEGAREVTQFGGWREFLASMAKVSAA
jgi:allophanate hydrolase